ncbi:tRNA pseudouridine synthase A [Schaalia canis]|uniref:tRNA pseudouridine synthase A n=1 Tax=Schaalia canis TaxID=100469 RepID=A0A3P1SF24_9ACTO|nr:tRNA pseudouridine synthase A [Schaalia canis]RRC95606.1 tRNA pseudouridine(38-40) synthase TruA [Schaalia canis]
MALSHPPELSQGASHRLRLDLAYDGTLFHGWATQPGLRTVEGEISEVLSMIARGPVTLTVAGRTDAGVHASAQTAHADLPQNLWESALRARSSTSAQERSAESLAARELPTQAQTIHALTIQAGERLSHRINSILARRYAQYCEERGQRVPRGTSDVLIHAVQPVSSDFDARFSAIGRAYVYRMSDGQAARSPLRRHDVVWLGGGALDVDAMNEAAVALLGEHDFLAYCRPRQGATTIRTLRTLRFSRADGGVIEAEVEADAFCHSMVRSLVGAAIEVGSGRRAVGWMAELLAARSREQAAPIAPAHGLTLQRVDYPPAGEWATRAAAARRRRDEVPAAGKQGDCCDG